MRRSNGQRFSIRHQILGGSAARKLASLHITFSVEPAAKQLSPPGGQAREHRVRSTLGPWVKTIDQMVRNDAHLSKRVRTSAMQIFQKLRDEHGYLGCYTVVQEYVYNARNPHKAEDRNKKSARDSAPGFSSAGTDAKTIRGEIPAFTTQPLRGRETRVLAAQSPAAFFCQSRHLQKTKEPEEHAISWMRAIQQGTVAASVLRHELPDMSLQELKHFVTSATKGNLTSRNRAIALMSYMRGIGCNQICSFLQISARSLYRYWSIYRETGSKELFTRKQRSDKQSNDEALKSAVFALLHSPPPAHGVNRTTWTLSDLKQVLAEGGHPICTQSIRAIIKQSGFKWRHARMVLTSKDPDYKAKVEAITKILSTLKSDEAFFSIDEYGPFAIRMKGGKKRVAPGEHYIVSQKQKSKGWLILTAALELSKNQVSHFYSYKKNTGEMIRMADTLRTQYRTYKTIYLSWDAASWHTSRALMRHLEMVNERAIADGFPIVKTAPLPAGAQFLNVIESVFSGMARGIIHNSDYPSVESAKNALDRYIADRNKHYLDNPQVAGKKIWGKERVPSSFAEGHNCKDPLYQYLA